MGFSGNGTLASYMGIISSIAFCGNPGLGVMPIMVNYLICLKKKLPGLAAFFICIIPKSLTFIKIFCASVTKEAVSIKHSKRPLL